MPAPTIVLDLDGTLIETAPDLIDTLNLILGQHGVPAVGFDDARAMIGAGVKPLLQRALASKGLAFPPEQIDGPKVAPSVVRVRSLTPGGPQVNQRMVGPRLSETRRT